MKKVKITEAQFYKYVMNESIEDIKEEVPVVSPDETIKEKVNVVKPDEIAEEKTMNLTDGSAVCEDEKVEESDSEDLMESIETTKGGFPVRKLIKESTCIKGEFKSPYGSWHSIEWNLDGTPINPVNNYDKVIKSITL